MRHLPDRVIVAVIVAAGLTGFLAALGDWTPYGDLNNWTYDFLVNHGRYAPTARDVVFVDFDDKTFAKIQKYPIPRSTIAQVIERIGSAKPAVIGLDILLSEARTPEEDADMQQALTSAGNVIIAAQAGTGQLPPELPLPMFCQPENPTDPTGFCAEGKPGAFGYAGINLPYDNDGYIRHAELFVWGKRPKESFPVFMAEQYLAQVEPDCKNCTLQAVDKENAQFHGFRVPYADPVTRTFLIGHWSPEPALHISASDVLNGAVSASTFEKKLVLIGQSSDAARDQDFTPLFRVAQRDGRRERIGGTALHAAAIETLLHGDTIRIVSLWSQRIYNLILLAAVTWIFSRMRLRLAFAFAGLFMAGTYLLSQFLFSDMHLFLPYLATELGIVAALPCGLAWQYVKANLLRSETEQQRAELMGLFSRYVDPQVAHTIWLRRDEVSLQGDERMATVLFSDIRNFTGITAGKPSKVVLHWLNRYFTAMDEVIREHGGFLNKFIGDGLLVVYGIPLSHGEEQDACQALRTAQSMLERVKQLNACRGEEEDCPELKIGIGIHTGSLTCGSVGSMQRLEYSVIGETVNLASRLESLNKEFHTEIILSEDTYARVKNKFPTLCPLGSTPVRGFEGEITVYGFAPSDTAGAAAAREEKSEVVA
ncbi:MAG TPA: adenylate/guanylate cyclase domain-containing protein [Terriglobales bacterium]